jgi:hypothetical protein
METILYYLSSKSHFMFLTCFPDCTFSTRTILSCCMIKKNILDHHLWKQISNEDLILEMINEWRKTKPLDVNDCMSIAVKLGYDKVVHHLIHLGANVDGVYTGANYNIPSLVSAVRYNHKNVAVVLLDNGANVNIGVCWPLEVACRNGHAEMVEILIRYKADIHAWDDLTFLIAIKEKHADIVAMLLDHGDNVHARNHLAFREVSSQNENEQMVHLLQSRTRNQCGVCYTIQSMLGFPELHPPQDPYR